MTSDEWKTGLHLERIKETYRGVLRLGELGLALTERIVLYLTPEEYARVETFAEERGDSLAGSARGLVLAVLTTLGK